MREPDPAGVAHWSFAANELGRLRSVRDEVLGVLRRYGEPSSDFQSCAVVLSELLSNAALHGPGGVIGVTLDWSAAKPLFAVTDAGRGFVPAFVLPPPAREGGRGLFLVRTLAATPQIAVDEEGCTVTVRLPVRRLQSNTVP